MVFNRTVDPDGTRITLHECDPGPGMDFVL